MKIDGKSIAVPKRVNSWQALLRALGIKPGFVVGLKTRTELAEDGLVILGEQSLDRPGKNVRWWEFTADEEYASVAEEDVPKAGDVYDPDGDLDGPWSDDPDAWKGDGEAEDVD